MAGATGRPLHPKSAGLFYFCLNPNSDDTVGLVERVDTPVPEKLSSSTVRSTRIACTNLPPRRRRLHLVRATEQLSPRLRGHLNL